MIKLKLTLVGESPLIMHNGQLSDPSNPFSVELKKLTARQKKTEDDHLEIRRVEWHGSLYRGSKGEIGLPADVVLATLVNGAKKASRGPKAKAGIIEAAAFFSLKYDGPSEPTKLYECGRFGDYRSVRIGRSRIMRSRPRFDTWELPIELLIDTTVIDEKDVIQAMEDAGSLVGICEMRPRYGRFSVVVS